MERYRRRRVLTALGTSSVVALAGCSGNDGSDDENNNDDTTNSPEDGSSLSVSPPAQQVAKLTADDGDRLDRFGYQVSISNDGQTAVVGAMSDEDPNGEQAGSAYVFEQSGSDWQQAAKLVADDGDDFDLFGHSVAISNDGTTIIIGAKDDEDPNGRQAGAAYVYERSDSKWQQTTKLTADDGDDTDWFGASIAMSNSGESAIIGARGDDDPNGDFGGSAYVFERSESDWRQTAKLAADDGNGGDGFGASVTISGDGEMVLIGAWRDSDPHGEDSGSAYVFKRSGDDWQQVTKLTANDGDDGDEFGWPVTVSGDGTTAIIGARFDEEPNGTTAGSAYVFERSGGEWQQRTKLAADDGDENDLFGYSTAVSSGGEIAIIGAVWEQEPNGEQGGSAYVFEQSTGDWQQATKLAAEDGDERDSFGGSAALSSDGGTVILGAVGEESPNGDNKGAAYVFE